MLTFTVITSIHIKCYFNPPILLLVPIINFLAFTLNNYSYFLATILLNLHSFHKSRNSLSHFLNKMENITYVISENSLYCNYKTYITMPIHIFFYSFHRAFWRYSLLLLFLTLSFSEGYYRYLQIFLFLLSILIPFNFLPTTFFFLIRHIYNIKFCY